VMEKYLKLMFIFELLLPQRHGDTKPIPPFHYIGEDI